MSTQLKGRIVEVNPTQLILDCNGVGYELSIALPTYSKFQNEKEILIYTKLIIREDAHLLYGFSNKEEREMFNLLTSVNGVGPASTIIILSTLKLSEISSAILNSDTVLLQKVKGIGNKTAQRIIIDLKDKVSKFNSENNILTDSNNNIKDESLNALDVLGVPRKSSEKHINAILKLNPSITIESLIKEVLKKL